MLLGPQKRTADESILTKKHESYKPKVKIILNTKNNYIITISEYLKK